MRLARKNTPSRGEIATAGNHLRPRGALALAAVATMVTVWVGVAFVSRSDAAQSRKAAATHVIPLLRVGGVGAIQSTLDATKFLGATSPLWAEPLTTMGLTGKLQDVLAQSVSHPNGVTYVFHLRHGVKFWDGNPMTSADVVTSLDYYGRKGSEAQTALTGVASIKASGPYTVVVKLAQRDSGWPLTFASVDDLGIFEKKFFEKHRATFGQPGTLIMASGPWIVTGINLTSNTMTMKANPHWWGGTVNVKRIVFQNFANFTSIALAMREGQIDAVVPYNGNEATFLSTAGSRVKIYGKPALDPVVLGLDVSTPQLSDVHVRRAIAYAIDTSAVIKASAEDLGPATPLHDLIPPAALASIAPRAAVNKMLKSLPKYATYNLAKAKQELAESAYPHGFTLNFNIWPLFPNIAQVIAADVAKIGITLNITPESQSGWVALVAGGNRPAIGIQICTPATNDPDPSYIPSFIMGSKNATAGNFNIANYAPASMDTLIAQSTQVPNGLRRLAIYGKMLKQIATDAPYVPLASLSWTVVLSDKFVWPHYPGVFQAGVPWPLYIRQS